MKQGRKPEFAEKTPDDELQIKMSHTKARKFKPQPRLVLALWHWWQAEKADVLNRYTTLGVTLSLSVAQSEKETGKNKRNKQRIKHNKTSIPSLRSRISRLCL